MSKFVPCERNQPYLLPQDMREWISEKDLAHFVLEAVEMVPMDQFRINQRGTGSAQYEPRMMLALLIYCYAHGIFSSRRIERATWRDLGVRFITANQQPDHATIAKFRRENFTAVEECFLQVLLLAKELQILKLGTVSVDGTKVRASASRYRSVTYQRAGELVEQLELEIKELPGKVEEADRQEEDSKSLPKEMRKREELQRRLRAARENAGAVSARASQEGAGGVRAEDGGLAGARGSRTGTEATKRNAGGDGPEQPDGSGQSADEEEPAGGLRAVLQRAGDGGSGGESVDRGAGSESELQRQAGVSGGGASIPEELGSPEAVLADNGYANGAEVEKVEADGVMAYVSTGAEGRRRLHDFRLPKDKPEKEWKADWLRKMAEKLQTDEGKQLYALRKQTVEPVFGVIKSALGFRMFSLRGIELVRGEWNLVMLAYNCKRIHTLRLAG